MPAHQIRQPHEHNWLREELARDDQEESEVLDADG